MENLGAFTTSRIFYFQSICGLNFTYVVNHCQPMTVMKFISDLGVKTNDRYNNCKSEI